MDKNVAIGDAVIVLGNCLGSGVVTELAGAVTGVGPELVEVDAKFVSGNSGSPVIHVKSGKVIGIATFSTLRSMDGFGKDSKFNSVERRFAYRLDNIQGMTNVEWKTFQAESVILNKVDTRTGDIWNLAVDVSKNGRIAQWDVHLRKENVLSSAVDNWQKVLAKDTGPSSRSLQLSGYILSEKQRLMDSILSALNSDLAFNKPETFTSFHKKLYEEQMTYREILKNYFRVLKQQISNDPKSLTR